MASYIQLIDAPSQQFAVGGYVVRLRYNFLANRWSCTIFTELGDVVSAGWFFDAGDNLLLPVDDTLMVYDLTSAPDANWYTRLTKVRGDGVPQTVVVYGDSP